MILTIDTQKVLDPHITQGSFPNQLNNFCQIFENPLESEELRFSEILNGSEPLYEARIELNLGSRAFNVDLFQHGGHELVERGSAVFIPPERISDPYCAELFNNELQNGLLRVFYMCDPLNRGRNTQFFDIFRSMLNRLHFYKSRNASSIPALIYIYMNPQEFHRNGISPADILEEIDLSNFATLDYNPLAWLRDIGVDLSVQDINLTIVPQTLSVDFEMEIPIILTRT